MTRAKRLEFAVEGVDHPVGALFLRPAKARRILVLAHGAGAGMEHTFMQSVADALAEAGMATLRYDFPYMHAGRRFPDRPPRLLATVRAAVSHAASCAPGLPILAGGKSMGGRMTSLAHAEAPLQGVRGLVFFGFPLHPPKKPGTERAAHLSQVRTPMLFLQGTRDAFAPRERLTPVVRALETAQVHWLEGADHGFYVLKSSGRTDEELRAEAIGAVRAWADATLGAE